MAYLGGGGGGGLITGGVFCYQTDGPLTGGAYEQREVGEGGYKRDLTVSRVF